jgi:hypothetical protein
MAIDYKAWLRETVDRLGVFAAERRALITILLEAGVTDWESRLTALRKTPEYQLIPLRYKALLMQAEVGANFEALSQLMQELNEGKPLN